MNKLMTGTILKYAIALIFILYFFVTCATPCGC